MNSTIKLAIFTLILTLSANVAFAQTPTTAEQHYKNGLQSYQQKNFQAAIISFNSCLSVNANATICKYGRGLAYVQTKDFDKAIADFTALLSLPNINANAKMQALNGRLQAYCLSGNVAQATADETSVKALGGNINKNCVQILDENPNLRPAPVGTVQSYIDLGDKALKDRNFKEALANYQKAINLDRPQERKDRTSSLLNSDFYVNLAIANRYNGNHDQSFLDLNKAIELNPQNYNAYAKRGEYYGMENVKLAEADLSKAISINPLGKEAYESRFYLYLEAKNYPKAISDLKKRVEINPDGMWMDFLAKTYVKAGSYKEAVTTYTKMINNLPPSDSNKTDFTERAESYYKLKDYKSALADLSKVESFYQKEKNKVSGSTRDSIVEFYILRGKTNFASGNLLEAVKDLTRAIEFNSEDQYVYIGADWFINKSLGIESYQSRAEVNCKLGKKQEAIADEKKVIELGGKVITPCK